MPARPIPRRPRVSVITIFLNAERFLDEAVESVLAQKYADWELLLVDDGSTDGSAAIAERYACEHPDAIRYLHHPGHENRGMSASRNLGLAAARGDLITLLDADDIYAPEKLAHQVALLDRTPEAGMLYGATLYWYSWTGRPEDADRDRVRTHPVYEPTLFHPPALFKRFVRGDVRTPCTCGVLMRREAVEAVGGFEDEFRGIDEDQVFFLKMALHTAIFVDPSCCDRYRQHPTSAVHAAREAGDWRPGRRPSPARARYVAWLTQYLNSQGVADPSLWRVVRKQARPLQYPRLYELIAPLDDAVGRIRSRVKSSWARLKR